MMHRPSNEKELSQEPAVALLRAMGYEYISPRNALSQRQESVTRVLLEGILQEKLKAINSISHKGKAHHFSDDAIEAAIEKLTPSTERGLLSVNKNIYDSLILGTAEEQVIDSKRKSCALQYIDWNNYERNVFHVTTEYYVENEKGLQSARPDIVLFVNGIPLCVIECKRPSDDISEAISQCIRNQKTEYIPQLFFYNQLLIAINKNKGRYGTTGTKEKSWAVWKELEIQEGNAKYETLQQLVNASCQLSPIENQVENPRDSRMITEQDTLLYSLCRPQRLLELVRNFIVFDCGVKKIVRYQQYFVVKSVLERIEKSDEEDARAGGIIWHTQGSGKSLIMVMLTQNLLRHPRIKNPRIVLVTDRIDLDTQLAGTFQNCDVRVSAATSGKKLLTLMQEKNSNVITTLVHKFQSASNNQRFHDNSADIFILVDESHRTQFGLCAAEMRRIFPKACYVGFTGTPLMKKEKNNFRKFGNLIKPHYSITDAIEDKAIVPLLYEGRLTKIEQNKEAIDTWFERYTKKLTAKQKYHLKQKYARETILSKADRVIYMRAFDITEHFSDNWKGTGFTAQLVAPNKASAIQYHEYVQEISNGDIRSEVIISPPDVREAHEEVEDEPSNKVIQFWKKMIALYGKEATYMKAIVDRFKNGEVDIIIVVSKLLTGFDAPRNTVLYLCKTLKEHTLLQAIGRVNRTYEGKEFGFIIDYEGILGELDKAFTMYKVFEGFDEEDLEGTLISIHDEIRKLPECYTHVWDVFKTVENTDDEEAYEVLLGDKKLRDDFCERFFTFSRILSLALSSEKFLTQTDEETLAHYKNDFRYFQALKASVKKRYADDFDYRDYDKKIKNILDKHIEAHEVTLMNTPANILNEESFYKIKEAQGIYETQKPSVRKKADTIAYAMKKSITKRMSTDPTFYERFSKLIENIIQNFKEKRISDMEYLERVTKMQQEFENKAHEDIPDSLRGNERAIAYYGVALSFFKEKTNKNEAMIIAADFVREVHSILKRHKKVDFWNDADAQNKVRNDIDDKYYENNLKGKTILSYSELNEIVEKIFNIAQAQDNQ